MAEKERRLTIGFDLLSKTNIMVGKKVQIVYDCTQKILLLLPETENIEQNDLYYVQTVYLDEKGRMYITNRIRNAFPSVSFLPSEKNGRIYIHIIKN